VVATLPNSASSRIPSCAVTVRRFSLAFKNGPLRLSPKRTGRKARSHRSRSHRSRSATAPELLDQLFDERGLSVEAFRLLFDSVTQFGYLRREVLTLKRRRSRTASRRRRLRRPDRRGRRGRPARSCLGIRSRRSERSPPPVASPVASLAKSVSDRAVGSASTARPEAGSAFWSSESGSSASGSSESGSLASTAWPSTGSLTDSAFGAVSVSSATDEADPPPRVSRSLAIVSPPLSAFGAPTRPRSPPPLRLPRQRPARPTAGRALHRSRWCSRRRLRRLHPPLSSSP